jgi:hypothetical protein
MIFNINVSFQTQQKSMLNTSFLISTSKYYGGSLCKVTILISFADLQRKSKIGDANQNIVYYWRLTITNMQKLLSFYTIESSSYTETIQFSGQQNNMIPTYNWKYFSNCSYISPHSSFPLLSSALELTASDSLLFVLSHPFRTIETNLAPEAVNSSSDEV